jgi:hypothetical protein
MSHELPDRFWALSTTSGLFAAETTRVTKRRGKVWPPRKWFLGCICWRWGR